ncbi:hypothetical protein CLV79_103119 [Limimaricola soesokkakensis]|uniref:Flp pilus assembly pilin Flp n=1 Tax=Limimaricola soesokkakensis TaxID=1343159 RepID=A0A1X6YCQ0_9RHOB|nr:hypothetical protein [Limimaricola soesokkakensis]PSK87072.1 hypothetical protein CLV79_103119 [Limimaricola soesokkakensis]SLN17131.1 hypothetical protein LOS8367_00281 [Limimaricola soesokkakensis]
MLNFFKKFSRDEAGAVTVDWVVLTAAIVGLGVAIMTQVTTGAKTLAGDISSDLSGQVGKTY